MAFSGIGFKDALKKRGDVILNETRQKQQNEIPKPMDANMKRDYNLIIMMRHSKRCDQHPKVAQEHGIKWNEKDEFMRPYDPPICDYALPIEKIKELQTFIPTLNVTKIVISPFLRCVETASLIAEHLKIDEFEIDARIGEKECAINRCIKHAKDKKAKNNKIEYEVPTDCSEVLYLSLDKMKEILKKKPDEDNQNEEKEQQKDIEIKWTHKEPAGNEQSIECVREYTQKLDKMKGDILLISHGGVLSDISEILTGKILKVEECGWLSIAQEQKINLYSPTSVSVIYDKNLDDAVKPFQSF